MFAHAHIHAYKRATLVSATSHTSANKAIHLRAHRKLTTRSHMYPWCLFVCLLLSTETMYKNVGKKYRKQATIVETKRTRERERKKYGHKPFFFIPPILSTTTTTAAEKSYTYVFLPLCMFCSVYSCFLSSFLCWFKSYLILWKKEQKTKRGWNLCN